MNHRWRVEMDQIFSMPESPQSSHGSSVWKHVSAERDKIAIEGNVIVLEDISLCRNWVTRLEIQPLQALWVTCKAKLRTQNNWGFLPFRLTIKLTQRWVLLTILSELHFFWGGNLFVPTLITFFRVVSPFLVINELSRNKRSILILLKKSFDLWSQTHNLFFF